MTTKEDVRDAMATADSMDLPDGAYWFMVHDILDLEYGDVFDFIAADPEFFGYESADTGNQS